MTTPTTAAVPSTHPQDLLFNAEKMDEAVNSPDLTYQDRSGKTRQTWAGIEADLNADYAVTTTGSNRLAAETARDGAVAAAEAEGGFDTLAAATAALASIPADHAVYVTTDGANNGFYVKQGGVLVRKSTATVPYLAARERQAWAGLIDQLGGAGILAALGMSQNAVFVDGVLPVFQDDDMRTLLGIDQLGRIVGQMAPGGLSAMGIEAWEYGVYGSGGYALAVMDADYRVLWAIDIDGNVFDPGGLFGSPTAGLVPPQTDVKKHSLVLTVKDFLFLILSGQSLARGWHGTVGTAILSTTQPYGNKMLGSVLAPNAGATSFAPLVESAVGDCGETIASGAANQASLLLRQRLHPWETFTQDWIAAANAVGGTSINSLMKGSSAYAAGQSYLSASRALALAAGKTFSAGVLAWIHGETDTGANMSQTEYATKLLQLKNDWRNDSRTVVGNADDVPMFLDQTICHYSEGVYNEQGGPVTPGPALAQYQLAKANSDIFLVAPIYFLPYGDGIHLQDHGYRRLGEYFGKAFHRVFIERRPWHPLWPIKVTRSGLRTVDIQFHVPAPPLVFDTTLVAQTENFGFDILDTSGNSVPVVATYLASWDTVRIQAGADLQIGFVVRNAVKNTGMGIGAQAGPRSNLRDSDATLSLYSDAAGNPYPMHNWAVLFAEPITA